MSVSNASDTCSSVNNVEISNCPVSLLYISLPVELNTIASSFGSVRLNWMSVASSSGAVTGTLPISTIFDFTLFSSSSKKFCAFVSKWTPGVRMAILSSAIVKLLHPIAANALASVASAYIWPNLDTVSS